MGWNIFFKRTCFLFVLILVIFSYGRAEEVRLYRGETAPVKLDQDLFYFVDKLLHTSKTAPHLRCRVSVRTRQEQRTFSTGTRWVELLEIEYINNRDYDGVPMRAFFPLGTKVIRRQVESEFAGTVEEIKLMVEDRLDHYFIFQHDGRGQIVWMMMGNSLRLNPCQISHNSP